MCLQEMDVPAQVERMNFPFLHLFFLFRPSVGWIMPAHIGEGDLLYSVCRFKCSSVPETPSQTYPEILLSSTWASLSPVKMTHNINYHTPPQLHHSHEIPI